MKNISSIILAAVSLLVAMPSFAEQMQDQKIDAFGATLPAYNRHNWKQWTDIDHDCQDTRQEALIIAGGGDDKVTFKTKRHCRVKGGHFYEAYTGKYTDKERSLDIDHIVPLKEAYVTGAYLWTKKQKETFANDPLVVIAVSYHANRQKGDDYPAEWMPPLVSYQCPYLKRWVKIKTKYGLLIRDSTKALMKKDCGE